VITLAMAYAPRPADAGPADWLERLRALGACESALKYLSFASSWQEAWGGVQEDSYAEWVAERLLGRAHAGLTLLDCPVCSVTCGALRREFPVAPALPEVRK
jgi:hypothetical protein